MTAAVVTSRAMRLVPPRARLDAADRAAPRRAPAARLAVAALALLLAGSLAPIAGAQCSMCKESAYDQVDQDLSDRLGHGFNASVILMLAVPFSMVGGLVWVVRSNNRARAAIDAQDGAQPGGAPRS